MPNETSHDNLEIKQSESKDQFDKFDYFLACEESGKVYLESTEEKEVRNYVGDIFEFTGTIDNLEIIKKDGFEQCQGKAVKEEAKASEAK